MSRTIHHSTLSGLIDDSDPDIAQMPESNLAKENSVEAKRGRGRPKGAVVNLVKTKASTARRASAGKTAPKRRGRPALADKTNEQDGGSETEEVDEFEQLMEDTMITTATSGDELDDLIVAGKQQKKAGKSVRNTKKLSKAIGSASIEDSLNMEASKIPNTKSKASKISQTKKASQSKQGSSAEPMKERIIPETQPMDLDDEVERLEEPTPRPATKAIRAQRSISRSRQTSVQAPRRRAGSASDTERSDPALRRRLGDMKKENDRLKSQYQNLREIGVIQAEQKFDDLKRQHEKSTKTANAIIVSLKADLTAKDSQLKESRASKKQALQQTAEIEKLRHEISKLTSDLSEVQIENKTLKATLAAKRSAASNIELASSKVPGSAVKGGATRILGTQEIAEAAEKAVLKEDLYSDLTGLLIRDIKREAAGDIYDCIQTGRNGTLHFKLAVSSEAYDDAECEYQPQLNASRDKELIDILGGQSDFLVDNEGIRFPRMQAAKFYAKVANALTEKRA